MAPIAHILANFTTPEQIQVKPGSMLWLLPLAAAIVVVYKATKVREVRAGHFIKDSVVLLGSILIFMLGAALTLLALSYFVTQ